jgi:RNA polymerase sigma-70 factor (ECF subfamily)
MTSLGQELRAIYEAHFAAIWQHLRRLGVSPADREDLAQEVFLIVHRKLESFDRSRPMRPWLIGIASRVVLHHYRSARRRPGDRASADELDVERVELAPGESPVDREARRLLGALLETLEPERRTELILHELEGFSVPEIAELTETPINTLYARLRRTRAELAALAQQWQQREAS